MDTFLTGLGLGLLFAAPWLAALAWVCRRSGRDVVWSRGGEAFPSQASQVRAFGGR